MTTSDHERALAAAEQACKAWDVRMQPGVLDRIVTDARNAAFEEAAKVAETGDWYGQFQTEGDERRAEAIATRIRALRHTEGSDNG